MSTQGKSAAAKRPNPALKRAALYAAALLGAFLLGLIPMWLAARERGREREEAVRSLRLSQIQNHLATAAVGARRGDYEPARRSASDFFSEVRAEMDRGEGSSLTPEQRQNVAPLLSQRDELITLLARSDPASADRLSELYVLYLEAAGRERR